MSQRNSDSNSVNSVDRLPDEIATPEGDGELDFAEPLSSASIEASVQGLQTPPGSAPSLYEADSPSELSEVVDAIDKVSRGKIQP